MTHAGLNVASVSNGLLDNSSMISSLRLSFRDGCRRYPMVYFVPSFICRRRLTKVSSITKRSQRTVFSVIMRPAGLFFDWSEN